ncbi:hypothetical protein KR222_001333 [Zaprionus bogoriensis]|nr:hypothetical protein KR222_001333 [Zaprionus bogoriensis]
MARFLSQALIKYQKDEEQKILSIGDDLDDAGKQLVRQLYEPLKISADDLSREYSAAEVRELCLRTKVSVRMTLFNCVYDARKRLERKGRLANRSERFVNRMLAKAVAKRMVLPYTPDEIGKCNYIRQCQLKKDNNCRLDRWHPDSLQSQSQSLLLDNSNQSLQLAQAVPAQEEQAEAEVEAEPALIFPQSQSSESQASSVGLLSDVPELWAAEKSVPEAQPAVETLPAQLDWVEAAVACNSQSMTLGTEEVELLTPQTESQPTEDYNCFDTQVPATSTQTQCTEPLL